MRAGIAATQARKDDLRALSGLMIQASDEFGVPGGDDPAIQADLIGRCPTRYASGRRSGATRIDDLYLNVDKNRGLPRCATPPHSPCWKKP
jgi:hypothetical protein